MLPEEHELVISVSEFVELLNQSLEYAFPSVTITGELANLRVSKGKWLYFDLKDDTASVKFFGTVYQLPGPLEDGMLLRVRGVPRLHNLYGFSVTVHSIQPAGEGTIKRAAELLQLKLTAEGLFDENRKRTIPYPPRRIGLITSAQSAAYADFVKIINARWRGLSIELIDVQVQGDIAIPQILQAIERFNALASPPEVLVMIRGGGSADDLAVWSSEQLTRAVAASRIPTLVAIGHEVDISLAELAADRRASTPSNAAELLVPDYLSITRQLSETSKLLHSTMRSHIKRAAYEVAKLAEANGEYMARCLRTHDAHLENYRQLLMAYNPEAILRRGYAIVRAGTEVIRHGRQLKEGATIQVQLSDAKLDATIDTISVG